MTMTIKEFEIEYTLGNLSKDTLFKLAEDSTTEKAILTILSEDKDINVRCFVAANPNTSKEVLAQLARDNDSPVRYNVLVNSNTSASACALIRDFDDCSVLTYIAARQCDMILYKYTNGN